MFQTLIGTVKRITSTSRWRGCKPVSNPHRYGQKHPTLLETVLADLVSNPHRYGQKELWEKGGPAWSRQFQTLIGTVKSPWGLDWSIGPVEFQTLIGTVKSASSPSLGRTPTLGFKPS